MELRQARAVRPQPTSIWPTEQYICWSRMQAEAGQSLEAIVERKERERVAGEGLFLWGVGNAPASAVSALARMASSVPVIFSVMKSRAKPADVSPTRTVVWRRYIDASGVERPLPVHSLVTSRGDSVKGIKRRHYALMCRLSSPLRLQRGTPFDPKAYRNVGGKGAPIGASQVTALLRRVADPKRHSDYEANIVAWLAESYWVRLTDPIDIDAAAVDAIQNLGRSHREWVRIVRELKSDRQSDRAFDDKGDLLLV